MPQSPTGSHSFRVICHALPTDLLIHRFHQLVNVCGGTFKKRIHDGFDDGIMSAIDFTMNVKRGSGPYGDRVNIVISGKFCHQNSNDPLHRLARPRSERPWVLNQPQQGSSDELAARVDAAINLQ